MNKVIFITGSSSGMGKSTAQILHQQGTKFMEPPDELIK
jgi:NADP-dependent 3-hydroxy acid dehydrogenase YdfG